MCDLIFTLFFILFFYHLFYFPFLFNLFLIHKRVSSPGAKGAKEAKRPKEPKDKKDPKDYFAPLLCTFAGGKKDSNSLNQTFEEFH